MCVEGEILSLTSVNVMRCPRLSPPCWYTQMGLGMRRELPTQYTYTLFSPPPTHEGYSSTCTGLAAEGLVSLRVP